MKKYLFLLILILVSACKDKKIITGDRREIFFDNYKPIINNNFLTIKINDNFETYDNYYGDSSTLNKYIENYKIDNFNFKILDLSSKRFFVNTYFFSNPIIVSNVLYYVDTKGYLVSTDLSSNKNIWKLKIIDKINFINYYGAKITYYNYNIYITSRLNEIASVNINGQLNWKKDINSIIISTPVIDEKNIYLVSNDNKLYILDSTNGQIKTINYGDSRISTTSDSANVLIYDKYIIVSYSSGELFILNKEDYQIIFNTSLSLKNSMLSNYELNDIDVTPIIKNNILLATAINGKTLAIDLNSKSIIWQQNISSFTNFVVNDAFIYIIDTDNSLVCLNLKDGSINWNLNLDKYKNMKKKKKPIFYKSMIFANNKIILFNNYREMVFVNPISKQIESIKKLNFDIESIPFSLNNKFYSIGFKNKNLKLITTK